MRLLLRKLVFGVVMVTIIIAVMVLIIVEVTLARVVLVNGGLARMTDAYGRRQVVIG